MSIEAMLTEAVNLAANAWDKYPDLRKLFGSAKPDKNRPLPISGENVGLLLRRINQKKQLIVKDMPRNSQGQYALAHAVINIDDYFEPIFNEQYPVRETILLDRIGFINKIRYNVAFDAAKADVSKVTNPQLRAVVLLHEARHLYSLTGHRIDPSTKNQTWNDYILWTGILGERVAW